MSDSTVETSMASPTARTSPTVTIWFCIRSATRAETSVSDAQSGICSTARYASVVVAKKASQSPLLNALRYLATASTACCRSAADGPSSEGSPWVSRSGRRSGKPLALGSAANSGIRIPESDNSADCDHAYDCPQDSQLGRMGPHHRRGIPSGAHLNLGACLSRRVMLRRAVARARRIAACVWPPGR